MKDGGLYFMLGVSLLAFVSLEIFMVSKNHNNREYIKVYSSQSFTIFPMCNFIELQITNQFTTLFTHFIDAALSNFYVVCW